MKKNNFLTTLWLIFLAIIVVITGYLLYLRINTVNFQNYSNLLGMNSDGSLITDYSNLKDSKLTGEEYSFDETYYPYYKILSTDAKKLYKQVYANFDNLETTFVPIVHTNKDNIDMVIEAVLDDHPEIFWMGDSYSYKYTKDGICRQVTLKYNKLVKNYDSNKRKLESAANSIIKGASSYSNSYDKELYVHNELLKRISYNENSAYNQTAYSALVNNSTVCAGYSKAFQYIMNKLGIPTYYVTGVSSGEDHAWNIVYLDGYYNIDLTWDDAASYRYQFFNQTDQDFTSSHKRSKISRYLPKCNSVKYTYENQNKKNSNSRSTINDPIVIPNEPERKPEKKPKEIIIPEVVEEEPSPVVPSDSKPKENEDNNTTKDDNSPKEEKDNNSEEKVEQEKKDD